MRPSLVTAPAAAPVSLSEFKEHIRESGTDQDDVLQTYLDAAVAHMDGHGGILGRCMVTQTWRAYFATWGKELPLPFPDVSSVTVQYYDANGDQQTVSSALHEITEEPDGSCVRYKDAFTVPTLDTDRAYPVTVDLVAGYGDAADVPADIKAAIKLLAAHWEQNREAAGPRMEELPMAFSALTSKYRRVGL